MFSLKDIHLRKKHTLLGNIDRLPKEIVEVRRDIDDQKCWVYEKGLRPDCVFKEKLELEKP